MSVNRPDVTDEDIGMRAFQLRKERAIERAAERVRRGLGHEWDMLTQSEIDLFGWALGELWALEDRSDWENMHFSKLKATDVRAIIGHAKTLRDRSRPSVEVIREIEQIVAVRS